MYKLIIVFLVVFSPFVSISQLSVSDTESLRVELAHKINELRLSKGLQPLLFNDTLKKAAEFHSNYMSTKDVLSHEQPQAKYKTPDKRVKEFEGNIFKIVGENVLYSSPQKFPLNKKEISELADEMFNSWKDSPGHYANMTEPEYVYGDLGFGVNTAKQIVFATQVFGTKGFLVENQLSKDGFGIVKGPEDCDEEFRHYSNLVLNMGNGIEIEGNEVVLYYHDITKFKKIFSNPKDGIAIDLISEDQFQCGRPNQLDVSTVFDGIILEPIFTEELIQNNRAESDYRLITKVGQLPNELIGKEFSASMILIKDGKACKFIYPALIPSKNYDLRLVEPFLKDNKKIELVTEGVVESQEVNYNFQTNRINPVKIPVIKRLGSDIYSIQVNSFSSVEGDSINNAALHNGRANYIEKNLTQKLKVAKDVFKIDARENWDQMNFQLNYFEKDELSNFSHDSLKMILKNRDDSFPWDSLLYSQRKAVAVINYAGTFEEDGFESMAAFNLRTAVATNNVALANKAMYLMYYEDETSPFILFEPKIMEFMESHPETVENYSANLTLWFSFELYEVTNYLYSWLGRADQLNSDSKSNLIYLYTLVGSELLDRWDVSAKRLSNVIHPLKIEKFKPNKISEELMLNMQLTFIQYYGQVNDGINIRKAFDFISNYFENNTLKPEDDADLTLFYNSWSMYTMTINHLLSRYHDDKLNEDGLFILAQTMNFTNYEDVSGDYVRIQEKALELNQERWCRWIDEDFQVKRNTQIKRLYCESCQ